MELELELVVDLEDEGVGVVHVVDFGCRTLVFRILLYDVYVYIIFKFIYSGVILKMLGGTIFVKETEEERKAAHNEYKKELEKLDIVQFLRHWSMNSLSRPEDTVYRDARRSLGYAYYGKWLLSEHRRILLSNLEALSKRTKLDIDESQLDEAPNEYRRVMALVVNRLRAPCADMCVVLTLEDSDISINYAYVYLGGDGATRCVCIGWNYLSSDGEYRPFLIDYKTIIELRSAAISVWTTLEDVMNNNSAVRNKLYYLSDNRKLDLVTQRIGVQSENTYLAAVWLVCAFAHYNSIDIPSDYNALIWRNGELLERMTSEFGEAAIQYISTSVVQYRCHQPKVWKGAPAIQTIIVGQKLMPLSKVDLGEFVLNPQSPPWRELYVSQLVSDMVINHQCHAFPMFIGWFPVFGINIQLFKNADMRDMITLSDQAQQHPIPGQKITRILKSNIALNICTEYVGQPPGPTLMSDPATFKRYVFDVAWGDMCLNDKGVIHSDEHARNATLRNNPHFKLAASGKPKKVVYIAPPHTFMFDDMQYTAAIIDFSRCLLLSAMTSEDVERMIALFSLMVTDADAQNAFAKLARRRLRAAFAAFTAFDLLVHMDRISRLCGFDIHDGKSQNIPRVHPECISLAHKIYKAALKWICEPHKHGESFNAHVIHTMFESNLYRAKKSNVIVSVVLFKPITHFSLQHYETLPPLFTTSRMQKEFGASEESVPTHLVPSTSLPNKIKREYDVRKNEEAKYVGYLRSLV